MAALAIYTSLVFHHRIEWVGIGALFILVWQIFTLDRYIVHPEDQRETGLDLNNARFVRHHRHVFLAGMIGSAILLMILCLIKPHLFWGCLFAVLSSLLYIFPFPLLKRRIKQISYLKSFYVPFVLVTSLMFFTQSFSRSLNEALVPLLLYLLCVLNVSLFDIKDVESDTITGIKTFASRLGPTTLIWVQFSISFLLGMALVIFGSTPPILSLGITFLIYGPAALILLKIKSVKYLFTAIDGMFIIVLVIYFFLV